MCAAVALLVSTFSAVAGPVQTVVLENFEGAAPVVADVTTANSASPGAGYSTHAIVTETGSKRLRMQDTGGFRNGLVVTIPNAIPEPGNFLITADIKVDSTSAGPIRTFGMGAKIGAPTTAKILDVNAGYVLNLDSYPTNGATLGYQTVGAAVQAAPGGTFPKALTLYFGTNVSGSPTDGKGNFTGSHRGSADSWPTATNTSSVYIDNIKRVGPGNFGDERHVWISIGDSITNLTHLRNTIDMAYANGFNCIDILVRYRANHYYVPNRDIYSGPNPEPYAPGANAGNDPIQAAIDRGHELGMRVYGAFSTFLMTDGHDNYPSYLPANTRTYYYSGGSNPPVLQNTTHDTEGVWMDPAYSVSQTYIRNLVLDLVRNYDLDGIIFDRIRYQGTNFGYNPHAMAEMGFNFNLPPAPTDAAWVAARKQRLAKFLAETYEAITDIKPWMIVGTVPIAYGTGMYDTYNRVLQDWPLWSKQKVRNRAISFGAQDLIQPQFYRQWNTSGANNKAPLANRTLMTKAAYGDTASQAMDYGLMPGANTNVAPLFYTEIIYNPDDALNTANAIAENICDTQTPSYFMNGSGVFNARGLFVTQGGDTKNIMTRIHEAATPCGDAMAPGAPLSDFLMKEGWDNTPPLAVTGATAVSAGYFANLTWTPPAPAADGESASRYLVYASTSAAVPPYYANQLSPGTDITGNSYTAGPFPSSGNYYFRIVPVDDYNNKGPGTVVGPVLLQSSTVIVESRLPNGNLTPSPTYAESPAMAHTTSKSTAEGLSGSGARYSSTVNLVATFRPNLPVPGKYNVYVTMGAGSNNNADAAFTITGSGTPVTGNVALKNSNSAVVNQWLKIGTDVPFAAGTGGTVAFRNINGNSGTARFVMDAVRFELSESSVEDWQLY